ncbi:hypothetical protein [Aurantimonas coralicida]|uniref:hypothetical protein n=1 Tax=Aurantimonas coralicida TaxID=182270 RepID=UPI000462E3E4|nr:hypothetical protein [Aurantimonas coralicida]
MSTIQTADPRAAIIQRVADSVTLVTRCDRDDLAKERDLLVTKWPGYRFMSPLEATMLFASLYRKQLKIAFHEKYGKNRPEEIRGFSDAKLNREGGEFTGMNRARQHADKLGVRYDEYVYFCLLFAFNRQRKMAPRPSQLGPSGKTFVAWHAEFAKFWTTERRLNALIRSTPLPQYLIPNYRGLPAQCGYRVWALELAAFGESIWARRMVEWNLNRRELPLLFFRSITAKPEHFVDAIDQIRPDVRARRGTPMPDQPLERSEFMQSCHGIPGAHDPASSQCAACPLQLRCASMVEAVERTLQARNLSTDPRAEAKKENDRQRQRDSRRNRKASAAAAPVVRENPKLWMDGA